MVGVAESGLGHFYFELLAKGCNDSTTEWIFQQRDKYWSPYRLPNLVWNAVGRTGKAKELSFPSL